MSFKIVNGSIVADPSGKGFKTKEDAQNYINIQSSVKKSRNTRTTIDLKKDKNNKKTDKVLQVFQVDTDDGKRYYAKEKGEYSNKYDSMLEFQMTNKIYRNKADSLSTDDFKYLLKKKKYPKKKK